MEGLENRQVNWAGFQCLSGGTRTRVGLGLGKPCGTGQGGYGRGLRRLMGRYRLAMSVSSLQLTAFGFVRS